ncbi:MAG: ATP-dependent zinc metalloprotease FtsH [Microthrixaceae bacterium]|nr:ATP-dependent zinc metalloprotease FtsH [Microthrixaceae bacterium]MCO5320484.1 ATP-dependent zinc metalloprotease FtsH [Microthrixaceae bacterium]
MPKDQTGSNNQGTPEGQETSGRNGLPSWLIPVLLAVVALVMVSALYSQDRSATEQSYSDFVSKVDDGEVESVTWNTADGTINGKLTDDQEFTTTGPLEAPAEVDTLMRDKGVEVNYEYPTPNFFATMIPLLLPFLLIIGFFVWMNRRAQGQMGGIMSIGRSKAKTYTTERPATLFADVAGYEGVKREITEVVDFLREPDRFLEIGAKIPKGVLLVGPPGTGKTLLARAVAGEAGVPFLSVSGSDFMEMFVGVGASRVRDLFESARKHGRAIIFIDEIDSVGRKRGAGLGGGHDEREQTLNQMLSEMDGFEGHEGVVMIAATNRPDILDPALLRPGRFDRQVVVPLPELEDRKAILAVHVRHKKLSPTVDLDVVSRGTPGMSGADLANLVNEAALTAVRRGSKVIEPHDFEEARDRVMMGQQRESMVLSDHEKEMTAYHEAGHALCAALLPNADPVHKVTILPRGMALGVTQQLPEEEKHSYSQEYLEESIVVAMGGRVAEDIVFGHRSTGAANDLQVSTERARKMVTEFGMSDRIGPRAYGTAAPVFLGEDFGHAKEYSEDTSRVIDDEVDRMLREAEESCRELVEANRHALDLIAQALLDDETVSGAEVSRLIRVANGTEPDVPSPSQPHHGSPGVPVHGHVPGSQNPGALPSPPPLPPHLNPGGGMARGISPDRT